MTSAVALRNSVSSVTNMAARLCGEARAGQILMSPRAYAVVEAQVQAEL
jgi:adenylate cyclase